MPWGARVGPGGSQRGHIALLIQERPGGDPRGFPWFAMPMQVSVFDFELNARNRHVPDDML